MRRPWKEAELKSFEAWDRRQRRLHAGLLAGLMLFVCGLALAGGWNWSPTALLGLVPPAVATLALAARSLIE